MRKHRVNLLPRRRPRKPPIGMTLIKFTNTRRTTKERIQEKEIPETGGARMLSSGKGIGNVRRAQGELFRKEED